MYFARITNRKGSSLSRPSAWVGTALLLAVCAAPVWGQNPTQGSSVAPVPEPTAATSAKLSAKEARDAKIAADAEKLYQMALDLKVEVDKSNKDTLSLSVVKQAAEVEKLAKLLKQEMRAN